MNIFTKYFFLGTVIGSLFGCATNAAIKLMKQQSDECGANGVKSTQIKTDGDDGDIDSKVDCK